MQRLKANGFPYFLIGKKLMITIYTFIFWVKTFHIYRANSNYNTVITHDDDDDGDDDDDNDDDDDDDDELFFWSG